MLTHFARTPSMHKAISRTKWEGAVDRHIRFKEENISQAGVRLNHAVKKSTSNTEAKMLPFVPSDKHDQIRNVLMLETNDLLAHLAQMTFILEDRLCTLDIDTTVLWLRTLITYYMYQIKWNAHPLLSDKGNFTFY